jgi:hypothetical protein
VIGIDEFGRGAVAPGVEAIEAPAKRLISEGPEPPKSKPLLTRDTRADLAAADTAWSDRLPGRVQALRNAPRYEPSMVLRRPDALLELMLVSLIVFAGTWATTLKSFPWRVVAAVLTVGLGCEFLYLFASRQDAWLPPLAMLGPGLLALVLCFRKTEPTEAPPLEAAAVVLADSEVRVDPNPRTLTRVRVRDLLPPATSPTEQAAAGRPALETPPLTDAAAPIADPIADPSADPSATPIEAPIEAPIATPDEAPIGTPIAADPTDTPIADSSTAATGAVENPSRRSARWEKRKSRRGGSHR